MSPVKQKKKNKAAKICSVPGCESTEVSDESLTWHSLPEGNSADPWIVAARLNDICRFTNEENVFICSLHFKTSDFEDVNNGLLKEDVVPSRFPWFQGIVQTVLHRRDLITRLLTGGGAHMLVKPDDSANGTMEFDDEIEVIEEQADEMKSDVLSALKKRPPEADELTDFKRKCNNLSKENENSRIILVRKEYIKNIDNFVDSELMKKWDVHFSSVNKHLQKLVQKMNDLEKSQAENAVKVDKAAHLISLGSSCAPRNSLFSSQGSMNLPGSRLPKLQGLTSSEPTVDGLQIGNMVIGTAERNLPPPGIFKRPEILLNSKIFGMKTDLYGVWNRAMVIDFIGMGAEKMYKIKFEPFSKAALIKTCTAKELAYDKPSDVRLPFGKRIIASYRPEDKFAKTAMYAGIIAEPPKSTNRFRYLIFFDDGYAQYTEHCDIRVVCDESKNVWEDMHPETREFIKGYCEQFPERPMLKLQKNQVIKTEYNSGWWFAKVVDVDASMVRMYFEQENRYEWIYRGSTRLAPLFNELNKAKHCRLSGKMRRHNLTARKNKDQPYVEYTVDNDEIILGSDESDNEMNDEVVEKPVNRNVAIKSTSQTKRTVYDASKDRRPERKEGELYFTQIPNFTRPTYKSHQCGLMCRKDDDPAKYKGHNPILIPLLMGWERRVVKFRLRSYNLVVFYRAPCGRSLRNIQEVAKYLLLVKSSLTVDLFTFESALNPLQSFKIKPSEIKWSNDDITDGKENVPIPCVNCIDDKEPAPLEYATERFPGKGVELNLDTEFLCGCDCTDNCQNPLKCQCQQLTIKAFSKDGNVVKGYKNRRLSELIITGIYECNVRCSCNKSCPNRVVQHGLQIRLQMFKTEKKGWGIRCLDDLDCGQFICIYAGQLLTEQGADEDGNQYGDEYLAELDHIEVAEKTKEGYESDVPDAIDIDDDVYEKQDTDSKDGESDDESDSSSTKSNLSQDSVTHDSDPEFEGETPIKSTVKTVYDTRSRNKAKQKRVSLFADCALDSDSSSNTTDEKKDLPDLELPSKDFTPIMIKPLSPSVEEALEQIEIGRKPKFGDSDSVKSGMKKKFQTLLKQPLPPPTLPEETKNKNVSLRSYFGETDCYIMDAKNKGNIGRYLNHSCNPNVFVQNVFFDTHDLRFPTVAFFSASHIKAGTELTWDYHYEVNSVPGKCLYCHCNSSICRGRLL